MVLNRPSFEKKALFMFDKGKVFLDLGSIHNLFHEKIKTLKILGIILSLFVISEQDENKAKKGSLDPKLQKNMNFSC